MCNLFKNRKLVIATMHWKEKVIKPILENKLWVNCFTIENFNTDKFGTFTRDIKRSWNMIEAARSKINLAMDISWCDLWVSSEWSFWMNYWIPINSNLEIVLFIDRKNNIEITWKHLSINTNLNWKYIKNIKDAKKFLKECGFPKHWIIVRLWENINFFINKNIYNYKEFKKYIEKIFKFPFINKIFIETDMRANKNPTRMKNIELATNNLVINIQSKCPKCNYPWFIIKEKILWLLCWDCLSPTNIPIYNLYHCNNCNYSENKKIEWIGDYAPPWKCKYCNP